MGGFLLTSINSNGILEFFSSILMCLKVFSTLVRTQKEDIVLVRFYMEHGIIAYQHGKSIEI